MENKKGQTALDVAKAYADPRIVAIVQKRWDEVPPPSDKKRKSCEFIELKYSNFEMS